MEGDTRIRIELDVPGEDFVRADHPARCCFAPPGGGLP